MSKRTTKSEDQTADFSELLRQARTAARMSVRDLELATRRRGSVKVSIAMISMLETDTRPPPLEIAYVLARVLSMDIETALSAAFRSRVAHSIKREGVALDAFAKRKHLGKRVNVEQMKRGADSDNPHDER